MLRDPTPSELESLQAKRQATRPTLPDGSQISEDFETALILLDASAIQELKRWLSQADLSSGIKESDEVRDLALDMERKTLQKNISDSNPDWNKWTLFEDTWFDATRDFLDAVELNTLTQYVRDLNDFSEPSQTDDLVCVLAQQFRASGALTDPESTDIWLSLISTYR